MMVIEYRILCLTIVLYQIINIRGQNVWTIINNTGSAALYPDQFRVPQLTVTYPDYGYPDATAYNGFHFFNIHGYVVAKTVEDCLRFCYAHPPCRAVNYIFSLSRCVSLGTGVTADRLRELWFDNVVDSIHAYFTAGPKPNAAIYQPKDPPSKSPFGLPAFMPNVYATKFSRIIGGTSALPYSYPWIVRIIKCDGNKCNVCGGTLLPPDLDNNSPKASSDLIATAGHCVVSENNALMQPSQVTVRLGNYLDNLLEAHELRIKARRIFSVQGFDIKVLLHDVAIIQLVRPIVFNKFINAIRLPSKDYPSNPSMCVAAGWGVYLDEDKSSQSDVLQQTVLPVVTPTECGKGWPGFDIEKTFRICASSPSKNTSTCQGDSGGPLVCPETIGDNQIFTLYGSTSFGDANSCLLRPSVFSRTYSYLQWMKSITSSIGTFPDNKHTQVPFTGAVSSRNGGEEYYYYYQ